MSVYLFVLVGKASQPLFIQHFSDSCRGIFAFPFVIETVVSLFRALRVLILLWYVWSKRMCLSRYSKCDGADSSFPGVCVVCCVCLQRVCSTPEQATLEGGEQLHPVTHSHTHTHIHSHSHSHSQTHVHNHRHT